MSDITINRPAQVALLLSILGTIGSIAAKQLPEIQRYLKIRSM
ncbi:MAG TPA: hypothetical protein VGL57_10835 [Solirubrobacteraceae bacterium]|jgi:hypothetical protein